MANRSDYSKKALLAALVENHLTDDQIVQLRKLVSQDPNYRELVVRHLVLHAMLRWEHGRAADLSECVQPNIHHDSLNYTTTTERMFNNDLPGSGTTWKIPRAFGKLNANSWNMTVYVVAVSILLILFAIWHNGTYWWSEPSDSNSLTHVPRASDEPGNIPKRVARLVKLGSAVWEEPDRALNVWDELPVGQKLRLASGRAELYFDKGARAVIQGPAELQIVGELAARVHSGSVRVEVGQDAKGFTIETSAGQIVDLGTEFGVRVEPSGSTELAVFDGAVNLSYPVSSTAFTSTPGSHVVERSLSTGQAIRVTTTGIADRVFAIHSDDFPDAVVDSPLSTSAPPVIKTVSDSIRSSDELSFYQIVRGGLAEDAKAYVDRPYQWNGVDHEGIPAELIGADYIMMFNSDRSRSDYEIYVELAQAADLYVFLDDRNGPPDWLQDNFRKTAWKIGCDEAKCREPVTGLIFSRSRKLGVGPGNSVDQTCSIWVMEVDEPAVITLGARRDRPESTKDSTSMYGLAAMARDKN